MRLRQGIKYGLIILSALLFVFSGNSQRADTAAAVGSGIKVFPDSISKLPARVTSIETKIAANEKKKKECDECGIVCVDKMARFNGKWVLVFLPVILFLPVGGFFVWLVLKRRIKLDETLSTGGGSTQTVTTRAEGAREVETITKTAPAPVGSTSRLIAFMSGTAALLIAVCLVTYYAYFMLAECRGNLRFEGLWTILAGLGIGIVPYGLNMAGRNPKEPNIQTLPSKK